MHIGFEDLSFVYLRTEIYFSIEILVRVRCLSTDTATLIFASMSVKGCVPLKCLLIYKDSREFMIKFNILEERPSLSLLWYASKGKPKLDCAPHLKCYLIFLQEVSEPMSDLKQGIEDLRSNRTFRYILAITLNVGNFLNGAVVSVSQ